MPTKVVLLSGGPERGEVLEAIRMGVRGVLLKELAPRLLVQCVRSVHSGQTWIERQTHSGALDELLRREAGVRVTSAILTARELEISLCVARGLSNKSISGELGITEGTVKIHLHRVYEKLRVKNRVELTLYAKANSLV
jgi:DNA-binding NarL/FixJ family response regulator